MHRTLKEIVGRTKARAFIFSDKEKEYKYTNSEFGVLDEYIYIPMTTFEEETFLKIEKHLKNDNCKGFFINERLIHKEKYLEILRKYHPKNVLIVENVYNAGFEVAKIIMEDINPKLIIVAGTDDTAKVRKKLALNLGFENLKYDNYWQKAIDAILRLDKDQKYVISETNIYKPKNANLIAGLQKEAIVLFTRISLGNLSVYKTVENYTMEWEKLVLNSPEVVITKDNNDFLRFPMLNSLVIADDVADEALKRLNVLDIKEIEEDDNNVIVDNSESFSSYKASIENFIKNNKDKRKIILFSKICHFEEFSTNLHKEILKEITEDVDGLVLVGLFGLVPDFMQKNKKTVVKKIERINNDSIIQIKHFLNWKRTKDTKILILSGEERLCSLI